MKYFRVLLAFICGQFFTLWWFWKVDQIGLPKVDTDKTIEQRLHVDTIAVEESKFNETSCERTDNVIFMNPFYTGGSTVGGILSRIALQRNKSVLTYRSCTRYNLKREEFCDLNQLTTFSKGVEMAFGHLRLRTLRRYFPADMSYITLLRHPFEQLQHSKWHVDGIDTSTQKVNISKRAAYLSSQYAELFGIPEQIIENPVALDIYLDRINKEFTLVGISEYFDEFLLLLKKKLCWSIEDILYIKPKLLPYLAKIKPGGAIFQRHKLANKVDYHIYNYFNRKMQEILSKQNSSFNEEFFYYRRLNEQVNDFCSQFYEMLKKHILTEQIFESHNSMKVPNSPWNKAFTITFRDCAVMKVNVNVYHDIFLVKRQPDLCTSEILFSNQLKISDICDINGNTTILPKALLMQRNVYFDMETNEV